MTRLLTMDVLKNLLRVRIVDNLFECWTRVEIVSIRDRTSSERMSDKRSLSSFMGLLCVVVGSLFLRQHLQWLGVLVDRLKSPWMRRVRLETM